MRLILALISTLLIAISGSIKGVNRSKPDDVASRLNSLVDKCSVLDIFSGTILAAKDGKIVFERSTGYSNREKNLSNNNATMYNIGSIGKELTAIMVLQLVQEGKLNLSDPVKKYIKIFPEEISSKIIVKQLLNHTSGMGDYIMNPEFQMKKSNYKSLQQILGLISKQELLFEPGTGKQYSNSGYCVLGGIIESVTGTSYEENLVERILKPLNMNSTVYEESDAPSENRAVGYTKNIAGEFQDNTALDIQPTPAGGIYSTVEDLLNLDNSLMNDNKLLDDKHKMMLFSGFNENPSKTFSEYKTDPNSGSAFAGGAPGINALYLSFPGIGYTAIILSNYDMAAENIETQVTSILKGKDFENPKLPLGQFLYSLYNDKGEKFFSDNLKTSISEAGYKIENDRQLNNLGYQFLNKELISAAVDIFKLNVSLFPQIANCYDSLGEAYLAAGNKAEALKNYSKVLEIKPDDENAKRMLEQINRK